MNSCLRRVVIISAPSGAGKSTLAKYLLERFPSLSLSVSATSRALRGEEQHGREYYFLRNSEFDEKIREDAFVEWEEVYAGVRYGTLRSELERIWGRGDAILFDVDVKGGMRLKEVFGDEALSVFIEPPSLEVLRGRLLARATDSLESIQKRLDKALEEIGFARYFDRVVVNDDLGEAMRQIEQIVGDFICDDIGNDDTDANGI
ncbi:MAG: guanylate kinase [Bacteroidales bacterium]|nr:guanylate kinase [Bacteroidales bacterium]